MRLIATCRIPGTFFHITENYLFAATENRAIKKVDLNQLGRDSQVSSNDKIFKMESTFGSNHHHRHANTYGNHFPLYILDNQYVMDFNENSIRLVNAFTKETTLENNLLNLDQSSRLIEILLHNDVLFTVVIEKINKLQQTCFLNVYKVNKGDDASGTVSLEKKFIKLEIGANIENKICCFFHTGKFFFQINFT